jgi:hypothetical protein
MQGVATGAEVSSSEQTGSVSLATAAQVVGVATIMLPVVGAFVRVVQYLAVPAAPISAAFSESPGSLAISGLAALAPLATAPLMVWTWRREWASEQMRAKQSAEIDPDLKAIDSHHKAAHKAVRAARKAFDAAGASAEKDPNVAALVEKAEAEVGRVDLELAAIKTKMRSSMTRLHRLLFWAHSVGGMGLVRVITVAFITVLLSFSVLLNAAVVLLLPFPEGAGIAGCSLLLTWPIVKASKGESVTTGRLLPYLGLSLLISALTIGWSPTHGHVVYVTTTSPSAVSSGWYVQLGDATEPIYLLTCSGDKTLILPSSSVVSAVYPAQKLSQETLLSELTGGGIHFGLSPQCTAGAPPP